MFKWILLIALSVITGTADARLKHLSQQHLPKYNMLLNPGGENGLARWSKTGSSTLTAETSSPIFGVKSLKWDPSASGEYLTSSATGATIPNGLEGKDCEIRMTYTWVGTAGEIQMYAYDGTNNVHEKLDLTATDSGEYLDARAAFTCPESGALRFRLESTADAAEITIDNMWVGSNLQNFDLLQAEYVGSITFTGATGCSYSGTSTSFTTYPADTDCNVYEVDGEVSLISAGTNGARIASAAPGNYQVIFNAPKYAVATTLCKWRLSDGTDGKAMHHTNVDDKSLSMTLVANFQHETAQSNLDFEVEYKNSTGTTSCYTGGGNNTDVWSYTIYRFPLASQKAVSVDTQAMVYQGIHEENCTWQRGSTSYGDFNADGTCTFTDMKNRGFTVSTTGSSTPGIEIVANQTGTYKVCAGFSGAGSSSSARINFRLISGSTVYDESITNGSPTADAFFPSRLCGLVDLSPSSSTSMKIQGKATAGNAEIKLTGKEDMTVNWTIEAQTQNKPQAYLVPLAESMIRLEGGSGHGTTDNKIRRFTSVTSTEGTAITRTTSAANGDTFTINEDGVYAITYTDGHTTSTQWFGISVNSTQLTTQIYSITRAHQIAYKNNSNTGGPDAISTTILLREGDVVRAHTDGAMNRTAANQITFIITQVTKL